MLFFFCLLFCGEFQSFSFAVSTKPSSKSSLRSVFLKKYLQHYLAEDESLQQAKIDHKISLEKSRGETAFWNSQLYSGPQVRELRTELSLMESFGKNSLWKNRLEQRTPWGGALSIEYNQLLGDDTLNSATTKSQTAFSFEKSLYRNGWGQEDSLKVTAARKRVRRSAFSEQSSYQISCLQGIKSYLESYTSQEKLQISLEVEKAAQKVFNKLKKAYKKKLIRKIDWLGAQADYLKTQSQRRDRQRLHRLEMVKFSSKAQISSETWFLKKPQDIELQKGINWQDGIELKGLNNLLEQREAEKKKAELDGQGDLGFQVQLSNTQGYSLAAGDNFQQANWVVSLNFSWPLYNGVLKSNKSQADLRVLRTFKEIKKQRKNSSIEWRRALISLENQKEQEGFNRRQQIIEKKRVLEARRLLITGRIEFENYISYRDQRFSSRLKYLDLLQEKILLKASLLRLSGYLGRFCEGLL